MAERQSPTERPDYNLSRPYVSAVNVTKSYIRVYRHLYGRTPESRKDSSSSNQTSYTSPANFYPQLLPVHKLVQPGAFPKSLTDLLQYSQ